MRRSHAIATFAASLALLAGSGGAFAQEAPDSAPDVPDIAPDPPTPPTDGPRLVTPAQPALRRVGDVFRRVDQGFDDRGPLGKSLLDLAHDVDLHQDSGWEHVYQSQTRDGGTRYYRFSGALGASFSRSEYLRTEKGEFTVTPPGTIFHIGSTRATPGASTSATSTAPTPLRTGLLPSESIAPTGGGDRRIASKVSGKIDGRNPEPVDLAPYAERPTPPEMLRTMFSDEGYRKMRLEQLLRRAARAGAPQPPE